MCPHIRTHRGQRQAKKLTLDSFNIEDKELFKCSNLA